MAVTTPRKPVRRQPTQKRAHETVEAVLTAVVRVLKQHGVAGVTTNRVAQVAGVSVGSVYQYFPDKQAIFAALHERHVAMIGGLIESTLVSHAESTFEEFVRALVDVLVDAHGEDPELHALLATATPAGVEGTRALEVRLRGTFRLALTARARKPVSAADLERQLFVLPHLVESLTHGAAYRRPPRLSLAAAKQEAVRAVIAYVRS